MKILGFSDTFKDLSVTLLKVTFSVLLCYIIINVNTYFIMYLPLFAAICVIGPLIEEYAKRLSIINKFPLIFIAVFTSVEFILYVTSDNDLMYSPYFIYARYMGVLMHFFTMYIQISFRKISVKYNRPVYDIIGFASAYAYHGISNYMAVFG